MRAVRLDGPFQVKIVDLPRPELSPGQARVRVAAAGICGSDMHRYLGDHYSVKWPSWPGHECAGTIVEVSGGVGLAVGQKVVIFPMTYCGTCVACARGDTGNCSSQQIMGVHMPGCMADELVVPGSMLRPLPNSIRVEEGAAVEPAAVAVHCANRARVGAGDRVAVLGAGAIGLLIQQVCRARGATHVLATGRSEEKMRMAQQMGADETVIATLETVASPERASAFDVVFDAVGSQETTDQAIALTRPGGRILTLAVPHGPGITINYASFYRKELALIGARLYNADFNEAIDLVASGSVQASRIITHRFPLEMAAEAYREAANNRTAVTKVLLVP
jgi:L-iditol 2-dehydrogenase